MEDLHLRSASCSCELVSEAHGQRNVRRGHNNDRVGAGSKVLTLAIRVFARVMLALLVVMVPVAALVLALELAGVAVLWVAMPVAVRIAAAA